MANTETFKLVLKSSGAGGAEAFLLLLSLLSVVEKRRLDGRLLGGRLLRVLLLGLRSIRSWWVPSVFPPPRIMAISWVLYLVVVVVTALAAVVLSTKVSVLVAEKGEDPERRCILLCVDNIRLPHLSLLLPLPLLAAKALELLLNTRKDIMVKSNKEEAATGVVAIVCYIYRD